MPYSDWTGIKTKFMAAAADPTNAVCEFVEEDVQFCFIHNETCDSLYSKLSTLTFQFDTSFYTMSPASYTTTMNGECFLNLLPLSPVYSDDTMLLGYNFVEQFTVKF